jgi:hypothetical protein
MNFSKYLMDVERLGLVLAVLAFGVGLYHLLEIRKVMRDAKNHTTALEEVRGSLSTRYIGQFPQYYPTIVDLIARAKRSVIIFCDFPAYGSLTDPKSWLNYKQILERKMQQDDMKVAVTCLDKERRQAFVREQLFQPGNGWNEWKTNPVSVEQLKTLLKWHGIKKDVKDLGEDEFFQVLEFDEERMLNETFARAETCELESYVPLHFWLIDDDVSAIFAIPSVSAIEYGFSTTDPRLISALKDMRDRYHHPKSEQGKAGI